MCAVGSNQMIDLDLLAQTVEFCKLANFTQADKKMFGHIERSTRKADIYWRRKSVLRISESVFRRICKGFVMKDCALKMTIQNSLCVWCANAKKRKGSFMPFNLQWPLIRSGSTYKSTTSIYLNLKRQFFLHTITFSFHVHDTHSERSIRARNKIKRFITKADNIFLLFLHCFSHSKEEEREKPSPPP